MKEPTHGDAARSPADRARDLLGRMTLEEKTAQLGRCWSCELRTEFAVDLRALAFHDLDMRLRLYPGNVKVMVGSSSADIRLQGDLRIRTEPVLVDAAKREYFTKVSAVRG